MVLLTAAAAKARDADGAPTPERRRIEIARARIALANHDSRAACDAARIAAGRATAEAIDPARSAWVIEARQLLRDCPAASSPST
jgi:hypothetical protein